MSNSRIRRTELKHRKGRARLKAHRRAHVGRVAPKSRPAAASR